MRFIYPWPEDHDTDAQEDVLSVRDPHGFRLRLALCTLQTPKFSGSRSRVTPLPGSTGAWRMASPSTRRAPALTISCMR